MTGARAALALAALAAAFAAGWVARRPRTVTVERVVYKDRIKVETKVVREKGDTVQVAGSVRTVIKREVVGGKCEETITTERAPVVTERRTEATTEAQTRTEVVTRLETRPAPPLPRLSLGVLGGADLAQRPREGVQVGVRVAGGWWLKAQVQARGVSEPAALVGLEYQR